MLDKGDIFLKKAVMATIISNGRHESKQSTHVNIETDIFSEEEKVEQGRSKNRQAAGKHLHHIITIVKRQGNNLTIDRTAKYRAPYIESLLLEKGAQLASLFLK